jgi:hypothetical protein
MTTVIIDNNYIVYDMYLPEYVETIAQLKNHMLYDYPSITFDGIDIMLDGEYLHNNDLVEENDKYVLILS